MEINLQEIALMLGEKDLEIVTRNKYIAYLEGELDKYYPDWRESPKQPGESEE